VVNKVVKKVTTETQAGECKILIEIQLDINLNNGNVSIKTVPLVEDEKVDWIVPDFSVSPKLNFGKEV
jgi:hypothetical protein